MQGDGWSYNNPLWKSTWHQKRSFLMDYNNSSSPCWGGWGQTRGAASPVDLQTPPSDTTATQAGNKQGAKGISTVWDSWGEQYILYTVGSIQSRRFLFFTCQGLFLHTHSLWRLPLVSHFVFFFLMISAFFSEIISVCSRFHAMLEWITSPVTHNTVVPRLVCL